MTQTRIAVVGYGLVGKRHVEALHRVPGLTCAAIVEANADSRQAAETHAPVFDTLEALIEAGTADGVILATPTPLHVSQGTQLAEAHLPMLIEKPIAVTSAEAQTLLDAAASTGTPVLVGHHRRHNGRIAAAKAALEASHIGVIRAVQATCWFYKPDSYFDAAPWRKKPGAGPISVNLVHDVDLMRHFCGDVVEVRAVAAPARRGYDNEDLASAILTFASGAVATLSVSDAIAAPWSWELTASENPVYPATPESCYLIGGSTGSLSLPDLRLWRHAETPDWWSPIGATSLKAEMHDPLERQLTHFAEVIHGSAAPLVSGEEGLRSLAVVQAVARAAATGEAVKLDSNGRLSG
ncbi:Gfo/Idh/MocA family protein [Pseudaestuariivita sp.]|uniref:Gfo/Idh/MocA family protein n=1 Tax=Pseudaestuariivita sp. TaxID=2211669 RepID=UPI00405931C0